ncbi:hypothetical protein GQ607_006970 [Colletotrichum asianum]|uniref:Multicopper oxidase n=1 Tax=Colletotrichum asianum TaxID=702518 RepID=A0A8H3ZNH0_9PEZI|nr:hypothetical protein GQ607_006970 [Colletotrichum asianum]
MLSLRQIWVIATDVSRSLFGDPLLRDVSRGHTKFDLSNNVIAAAEYPGYPDFSPTGSNIDHSRCQYPSMKGWHYCGGSEDQSCWLRNPETGEQFNITTDYEDWMPYGIDRYFTLDVADGWVNVDGLNFTEAKLFNSTLPGPLIEACWGDRVHVNVTNSLGLNGTSIHWHGIRQKDTMHMDGVNGITQCPIAPEDYFVYIWNATQYGSSWYHSHYSVQYADGLQAPITIHGPTVAPYDEAIEPLIITDWLHNGAFNALYQDAIFPDILLGSVGHTVGNITRYNSSVEALLPVPEPYEIHFNNLEPNPLTRAKRYLIRLINTSWQTTFVFSIDNHLLTIVEADFVPATPFNVSSLLVSIGQRYNIIVEASPLVNSSNPAQNPLPDDCNFWIRTWVAGDGGTFGPHPIHLHGHDFAILREVDDELWDPTTYDPTKNNLNNPPRRDVVLLPSQGYVVIGFKTDNPGVWLIHCHIAFHAAGGLSMQILERQSAANEFWPPGNSADLDEAYRVCENWNSWAYDCRNLWPGEVPRKDKDGNPTNQTHWPACEEAVMLQNDSGV